MRRFFVFLAALLPVISLTAAQPTSPLSLRDFSSPEAFIAAMPENRYFIEDLFGHNYEFAATLYQQLEWEFNLRYGDTPDWRTLLDAYERMDGAFERFAHSMPYMEPEAWYLRILRRWLEENPTNFSITPYISSGPITIEASHLNPDSEGDPLYMLYFKVNTDKERYEQYVLATPDYDRAKYNISPFPIPFASSKYSASQYEWGGSSLIEYGDLDGDGRIELIFDSGYMIPSSASSASNKTTYLLGLRNGELAVLARAETYAETSERHFENTDTDAELEWIQTEFMEDNWRCTWQIRTVFDWDGDRYTEQSPVNTWSDSMNCALRDAHAAMRMHKYVDAIPLYQRAVSLFEAQENPSIEARQFGAYAHERLVIAYAMAGYMPEALELLDTLKSGEFIGDTLAAAMLDSAQNDPSAESLCRAAYDTMGRITKWDGGYETEMYRDLPLIAYTNDLFYGAGVIRPDSPAFTACDYPNFGLPPTATPTPRPTATAFPTLSVTARPYVNPLSTLYPQISRGEYTEAVETADNLLSSGTDSVEQIEYMRAVALDLAGERDAAAEAYNAIWRSHPRSIWGFLAAMHLEPTGD